MSKMQVLMKTPRLGIGEITLSDLDRIREYARDTEVMRYLMLWFDTDRQIEDFVNQGISQADSSERKEYVLTIETIAPVKFVGTAIIAFDHDSPASAEIGYIITRSEWGKGYATETAQALIGYGFRTLKLHRVFGKCDERNSSSARVLEKCGLKYEGTRREHIWLRDHWRSSRFYGILDQEFMEKESAVTHYSMA
jgi:ribosomal-protein-alanine N-acetyltransferase